MKLPSNRIRLLKKRDDLALRQPLVILLDINTKVTDVFDDDFCEGFVGRRRVTFVDIDLNGEDRAVSDSLGLGAGGPRCAELVHEVLGLLNEVRVLHRVCKVLQLILRSLNFLALSISLLGSFLLAVLALALTFAFLLITSIIIKLNFLGFILFLAELSLKRFLLIDHALLILLVLDEELFVDFEGCVD